MWRASAQNAKGWWDGRGGCAQGGSGDAAGRAIWVWRLASAAARLVLFGDGQANEPLVGDDAGAVLVVAVVGGRQGSPRQQHRRCEGGQTVRCRSPGAAGRPCTRQLWSVGPACRADGLPAAAHRRRLGQRRAGGRAAAGNAATRRRAAVPWRLVRRIRAVRVKIAK